RRIAAGAVCTGRGHVLTEGEHTDGEPCKARPHDDPPCLVVRRHPIGALCDPRSEDDRRHEDGGQEAEVDRRECHHGGCSNEISDVETGEKYEWEDLSILATELRRSAERQDECRGDCCDRGDEQDGPE